MKADDADRDLRSIVAEIVAAYVGGNSLSAAQLPDVIRSVPFLVAAISTAAR